MVEFFKDVVRKMKNVPTANTFERDGKITPEQFVAAGDNLVFKCPTWRWEGGLEDKRLPFLPPNKQFLITSRVPCKRRAARVLASREEEVNLPSDGDVDAEGWVATNTDEHRLGDAEHVDELPEIGGPAASSGAAPAATAAAPAKEEKKQPEQPAAADEGDDDDDDDDDDIPELDLANLPSEADDPAALPAASAPATATPAAAAAAGKEEVSEAHVLSVRTYNVIITYDLFYQSPRVWLAGIAEDGATPLTKEQIFEDISEDHARKTVTIEPHPHLGTPMASIHPCKHSSVMKQFSDRMAEAGKVLRPEHYFFLFLKFLSAVCPTIEMDYTMEMEG